MSMDYTNLQHPRGLGRFAIRCKKVAGSNPTWPGPFCVEFGCSSPCLAPPSAPRLYLQTPADPRVDHFSLVCVTFGFYPSDLSLYWTNQSAASPIDQLSINNCSLTTAASDQTQSPHCVRLVDEKTRQVYLMSVLRLQDRQRLEAAVTYVCVVEGHPDMTEPLSAAYVWEAPPNVMIGALNVLKMCLLSAVTAVFSLEAVKSKCS
ncbi:hypothetical protein WMY93_031938 [Mugilogobius chulae]|uniref:Ig-like domain-containing protein n=1 Tax=Mugilogobius chulae TaxID=88201 RepID=A0AAW0MDS7_9GOBI